MGCSTHGGDKNAAVYAKIHAVSQHQNVTFCRLCTARPSSVRTAQTALDVALRAVRPWTGTIRQLADLDVPDQAIAVDHQRQVTKLSTRIEDLTAPRK